MTNKAKKDVQFAVSVRKASDGCWAGEVVWINTGRKETFRSALELIKLLDSAVSASEEDKNI